MTHSITCGLDSRAQDRDRMTVLWLVLIYFCVLLLFDLLPSDKHFSSIIIPEHNVLLYIIIYLCF